MRRAEYAEIAVGALTNTGHEGKLYERAGDRFCTYTRSTLAAEISHRSADADLSVAVGDACPVVVERIEVKPPSILSNILNPKPALGY